MRYFKNIFSITAFLLFTLGAYAQWNIPAEASQTKAPTENSIEAALAGKQIYEIKCKACHQEPGATGMKTPAPPDLGTKEFLSQTDGDIFWKMSEGMGGMPPFKGMLSDAERWNVVHYLTSKREGSGIDLSKALQKLEIKAEFVTEGNKIKAIVSGGSVSGIKVGFYVKRYFGNLSFAKKETNESGMVTAEFPTDIPGNEKGEAEVIVRFENQDRFGKEEAILKVNCATPFVYKNPLEERTLWGISANAPLWLIFSYLGVTFSVWVVIIYIVLQILKLKKAGKTA